MSHLSKSMPRHLSRHWKTPRRPRWYTAGIYAGIISLAIYSQLQWAVDNDYAHIIARLIAAVLAGWAAAWLFIRLVGWLAQRHGKDEEPALRRWSYSLALSVLILLAPLYHPFLFIALLCPWPVFAALSVYQRIKAQGMLFVKRALINLTALMLGLGVALALGELTVYLIYRDFLATNRRSPNMHRVTPTHNPHHRPHFSARGPGSLGPKPQGVSRVLVIGDSVTAGAQPDWRQGIPNQLLEMLNHDRPRRWQMDVLARAGHEIHQHYKNLSKLGHLTQPDVIVYIWYVNDMEVHKKGRPASQSAIWRNWPSHQFLREHSYLYRFLDIGLESALPRFAPTYMEYLAQRYQSGTFNWAVFNLLFHMWLDKATTIAPRTIVYLYPALPRRGLQGKPYPLSHIHRQIIRSARTTKVSWPAWVTPHAAGLDQQDRSTPHGAVRLASRGTSRGSIIVDGPLPHWLHVSAGDYQAEFRLRVATHNGHGPLARLRATDGRGHILASREVSARPGQPLRWQKMSLPFTVGPGGIKDLRLQVQYLGGGEVAVDQVTLHWPRRGRVEVVDGTPALRDLRTWQNQFDGHPNAQANQVVARTLARAIMAASGRRMSGARSAATSARHQPDLTP